MEFLSPPLVFVSGNFGLPTDSTGRVRQLLDSGGFVELPTLPITPRELFAIDSGGGLRLHAVTGFYVYRLDGTSWTLLFATTGGVIDNVLEHDDGTGPAVFMEGNFTAVNGVPARGSRSS